MDALPSRKRLRYLHYDYSAEGLYFVTFCVQHRWCVLGDVVNGELHLSAAGAIAAQQWEWLALQYRYVAVVESVIMPDHVHALLKINPSGTTTKQLPMFRLIGAYKTTSCKHIRAAGFAEFRSQRSFFDRVIRDEKEYEDTLRYIRENPACWNPYGRFSNRP